MKTIEKTIINFAREAMNTAKTYGVNEFEKKLSIRDRVEFKNGAMKFYLWDSEIFTVTTKGDVFFNFHGYATVTTKGRINAYLGAFASGHVNQKNYALYFNGVELDASGIYHVYGGNVEKVDFNTFWDMTH